jgi:hypothetical protein
MKYKIRIFGYGSEVAFGHVDQETKDKITDAIEEGRELSNISNDEDVLGKSWFEINDIYSNFHANDEFNLEVTDESGEVIFEARAFDLQDNEEETIEYEYFEEYLERNSKEINEDFLLMNVSGEKGTFFTGDIEDESFDLEKLKIIIMGEIGTNDFYIDDMVSKVMYGGKEIESNDMSTNNKSFDSYINM